MSSFSHSKPLGPMIRKISGLSDIIIPFDIKDMIWQPFCFQNKAKITFRQAFLSIYILCKSDEATCNILSLEHIHDFRTISYGGNVVV